MWLIVSTGLRAVTPTVLLGDSVLSGKGLVRLRVVSVSVVSRPFPRDGNLNDVSVWGSIGCLARAVVTEIECFSVAGAFVIFWRALWVGEGFLKGGLEKEPRDRDRADVDTELNPRRVVELEAFLGSDVVKLDIVGRSGTAGTARRKGPTNGCRPGPATGWGCRPTGRDGTAGTGSGRIF